MPRQVWETTCFEAVAPIIETVTSRTWHDALLVELVNHGAAEGGLLVKGLLEQDGARNVLAQAWGSHQELAVRLAVCLGVLQADRLQTLAARGVGLIHSQNSLAGAGDFVLQTSRNRVTRQSGHLP